MRKVYILSFFFLLSAFTLHANDLYWIGGSGNWNDPSHWSNVSGGAASFQVPDENTDVFIDQKSLSEGDLIQVNVDIQVNSIVFNNNNAFTFSVSNGVQLHISEYWSIEKSTKAHFEFNVSVISLTMQPNFKKVDNISGGAFLIKGVSYKWEDDKWVPQNMFKSGHIPVATVTDPLCNGGQGSALGSVIGGVGPFQYFWTGGTLGTNIVPGNPINNIGAGTYTLIVFDLDDGSNETINFVVTEPSVINAFFIKNVPTCVGFNDGSITANIFGGTPGTSDYTVNWSSGLNESGVTTSTATNLAAGPYNLVITDSNGCQVTRFDTLLDPTPVFVNATVTNVSCNGVSDGSISTNATSGNGGPFTYDWGPDGETTNSISGKPAGIYTLHLEDVNNCPKDTSIEITEPLLLTGVISSITHLLCNGDCSVGEAIATPTGGTFPYTYQWFDAGNNPIPGYTDSIASNLCAGTYSVSITDANLCNILLTNVIINEPPPFTGISNSTPANCNGESNGSVIITPSGGTLPYTYTWATNPGAVIIGNDSLEAGLPAGDYDYLVLDGNNCFITGTVSITEPDTIGFDFSKIDLLCNGDINGQAVIFNVAGGDGNYSYLWQDAGMNTIGTGLSVNTLAAGNYTITVSDGNNCSTILPFEIIEPTALSLTLSSDSAACNGDLNGAVHVIASGGTVAVDYSYDWRDALNNPMGTTADVLGLPAGTYTVTVTDDNNCSETASVDVLEPLPIIITETIGDVTCSGDMDGFITIAVSGGSPNYTFSWTGPNGFLASSQNINALEGGTYTLTLTDANNCIEIQSYIVDEPLPITFTPTIMDVSCFGLATGSIQVTVNGGNGGYIYDWRDVGNNQISITDAIVNVIAGDYTLTVIDAIGCNQSETYTINESSEILINASITPIECFNDFNGVIDITPSGGAPNYTYAWTGPNGFNSVNQNISGLEAGTYDLTITDQNLCTKDTSIILANPPQIIITETITPVTCSGDMDGSIDVLISGGVGPYLTDWVGPNGFVSSDQNIANLEGGNYTLTVTDANNCVLSFPYVVAEPLPYAVASSITHVLCYGDSTGSIQVVVSGANGGYSYDWRDAANIQISTTDAIVNVPAGDYTLNITDALGCFYTDTYTINEVTELFFNVDISIISCFDADDGAIGLNPSGGTPLYSYAWVGPNGFNSVDQFIFNLEDGDYTVTVTDQNSCSNDTTITLLNPAPIAITETIVDVACNGDTTGEISLSISGGTDPFIFDWSGPNGFVSNSQNITGLEAGDYTVIATDAGLCSEIATFTVDEPTAITITSNITHVACKGDSTGSIQIIAAGGAGGFLYEWTDALNNVISVSDEILDVPAGDYTITITDASNCEYVETLTISEPLQAITLTLSTLDIDCFGDNTGAVAVAISGGTVITPADYTIEWYDSTNTLIGNTQIVSDLVAGEYYVIVTDLNNCVASDTIEVIQSEDIQLNEMVLDALCNGEASGNASVTPTGGNVATDYTYEWESVLNPGVIISTTNSINNVVAGDYLITVYDDNACFGSTIVSIGEASSILVTFSITEPLCNGDLGGEILASVTGGTVLNDYTYEWQNDLGNPIGSNALINGLNGGNYTLFVWDDNNCEVQVPVSINEPAALTFAPSIQQIACASIDDGEISVNVSGGTTAYSYEWTNSLGNVIGNDTIVSNLAPDDYTFTVVDANGCTYSETYTISPLNIINLGYIQYELGDCSTSPPCIAAAAVFPSGGSGVYTNYQWVDQLGNDIGVNNDTATGLCAGSYLVTVTDSDNCSGSILVLVNDQSAEDMIVELENPLCNGETGTAIAQYICNDAPCSIEWFNAVGNLSLGLTSDTVQLAAGDYFVLIANATGCSNRVLFTIDEPALISPNPSSTPASCDGACDGTASVMPSGGTGPYTYQWNDPMAQNTPTAIDLCAGDYEVTITDANLCDTTIVISVSSPSPLTVNESITDVNCQNGNDGSIDLTVSGGSGLYSYLWNPEPLIGNGTANGSGLIAGDYEVTIEDVLNPGCLIVVSYTIDQPDSLEAVLSTVESTCNTDDGEATVLVSGGTPDYTYLWNDPAAQTTATATGLFAGIYTVTVTDDNLCTEDFYLAVNDDQADTLSVAILPGLCPGDSSEVSALYDCLNPVCIITWYEEDGSALPIAGDVVTLPAGTYWVGIENNLGCEWFLPFTIDAINPIEPNLDFNSESCNGPCDATASINPFGGSGNYTITWSPEPPLGQGTTEVSGLCPGIWQVVIEDEIGCDTTVTFEILEYVPVSGLLTYTDASCNGDNSGSASVIASGGQEPYSYTWAPEPGSGQGNPNVGGLYAGDWTITIADASGCDTTLVFTILEPSAMEADSVVVNASCNVDPGDGSIDLIVSGGSAPYVYQWFDAAGNDLSVNSAFIDNLVEGIYHCVVTDDSLCTETFVAIVSEVDGEALTPGSVDVSCYGGSDGMAWVEYLCGDTPCSVNWYDALGVDLGLTTDTIVDLIAGSYVVGVSNGSGCVSYLNIVVEESPEISIDIVSNDATCSGICDGSASASVTGGTGDYAYLWIPEPESGQGTASVTGLCGGDWMLIVTDEIGCVDTAEFSINDMEIIAANIQVGNETCELVCDGWASVNPSGGSGDYTYLWSPEPDFGQGTDSASGLCGGDWSVLITDANTGCNITELFTISQLNPIFVTDTLLVNPECENDNSGSISISASGGIPPFVYQWLDNNSNPIAGETDTTLMDLTPGGYYILITDDVGCTHSEYYELTPETDLTAYAGVDTTYCQGGGPATFIGVGNGMNSIWTDILGNVLTVGDTLVINAPVGNIGYIYQTSDGICVASDTAYVIVEPAPIADAGEDKEIFLEQSIEIGGDPTGPDGSIYTWTPTESLSDSTIANPIAEPIITTEYIVYVEWDNGCSASDTVIVIVNPRFIPNNGFTPNGDGKNDVWTIGDLRLFPDVEVSIFNRWGQQLFTSKGYTEPWDGTYDGKDVPVGTYYYVIDLKDEKYPDAFTGPLTIMR